MLFIAAATLCAAGGCHDSQSPGPDAHEWFVFVSEGLSAADHQRLGDELAMFAGHLADPGDVIHVLSGDGLVVSFTIRVAGTPGADRFADLDSTYEMLGAAKYFNSFVHLEGLENCSIDCESIGFVMKRQRMTDLPVRVILVGRPRRHWFVDGICDCPHAPHSLLNEIFSQRFHPEYTAPTRSEIDFKRL
ncbi:MAG: hypothetical protein CMJ58_15190 [Planctomycetaceae bacterium]|nr:hypothetical protein [Planctomycetaceae bacterium]